MNLVKSKALLQLRPARKVAEGVAEVVWACSPLRRGRTWDEQVTCGGRGVVPGEERRHLVRGAQGSSPRLDVTRGRLSMSRESARQLWWAALRSGT
ncbi:hypothetical protein NDU88_002041 [Pleurodeles waltl]|uniref:Uncharacterized protein n=1 Tax=Pleurodeles waltl TaxID=8319 RepID=A0AAV7TKP4_PLEWA|nr:hypothetical protein NDU88_002041 [Pleurodeles waltl]